MGKHWNSPNARLGAVATAVLAVVMGTASTLPARGHGEAAVMVPTGVDLLYGVGIGESLPPVDPADVYAPAEPRQVDGPDKLPDPVTPPASVPGTTRNTTPPAPYVVSAGASRSIPPQVLAAYQAAAHTMITQQSSCHLPWALLAGIGRIESDHADNGNLDATGKAITPIVGPKLDGTGNFARIMDTDHGRWDGDKKYDRAVGPMQFLPETWRGIGQDGNGDGVADPENIYDATLGTAAYLCAGGGDLSTRNGLLAAVYRYNRSWDYVSMVLTWAGIYAGALPTVATTAPPTHTTPPTQTTPPAPTTGGLTGKVLDLLGNPLSGVTVLLHGPTDVPLLTDETGTWQASGLAPGAWTVQVTVADGFALPTAAATPVTVVVGDSLQLPPFALGPLVVPPPDADPGTVVVSQ